MAKKKNMPLQVSQEDKNQAQQVLEQYHQVAEELHTSASREQAETALTIINAISEPAQMALLKALSKETHTDAADVLVAVNELSPVKSVRKEARRSLIQLEGARIYPGWSPPADLTPFAQLQSISIPRLYGADTDLDEESEDYLDLSLKDVVIDFVESWSDGDYDTAYDLLTTDSPIREGLSKDEWVERRETWADEANPIDLEPDLIYEREAQEAKLWLPDSLSTTRKEIQAVWSIELDEAPLSETPPELPKANLIYEETGRHWFWASYILIQEQGEWRIQNIIDEGTNALSLPPAELQSRIKKHDDRIEEITKQYQSLDDATMRDLEEMLMHKILAAYYIDALVKVLPNDRSIYEQAVDRLLQIGELERAAVYLELLTQRFEEQRAQHLRQLAQARRQLSEEYFDLEDEERGENFLERAEEALRESLALENSFEAQIALVEVLLDKDEYLDEAEDHLLQAKAMVPDSSQEAHVEMHLGDIAMERERYEEALSHYQRVADLEPGYADSWVDLAEAYKKLGQFEKAEASYRHATQLQPDNEDLYYKLSKMYAENNQHAKAYEAIEDGLNANPDSAILNVYLGSMYLEDQDYSQAEILLDRAERLDPGLEVLQTFRQVLNWYKPKPAPGISRLGRPKHKKNKKRGRR
jgi:tetratricopeptide (TPR) repeat protein